MGIYLEGIKKLFSSNPKYVFIYTLSFPPPIPPASIKTTLNIFLMKKVVVLKKNKMAKKNTSKKTAKRLCFSFFGNIGHNALKLLTFPLPLPLPQFYTVFTPFYTGFTQFLHRFYTVFTQFLHSFYTVFTQVLHSFYTVFTQLLRSFYTVLHSFTHNQKNIIILKQYLDAKK